MNSRNCDPSKNWPAERPTPTSPASSSKTAPSRNGGKLAFLLTPLFMLGGCPGTPAIVTCRPDPTLVQPLQIAPPPQAPTNGDLAKALATTGDAIQQDNEKKARLLEQIRACD